MTVYPQAGILAERILNSLPQGLLIALAAWALLKILGRRNASTRFAVWFMALLVIVALPWLGAWTSTVNPAGPGESHTAFTASGFWAVGFLTIWAVVAGLGLLQVAAGLWQLRTQRAQSTPVDLDRLDTVLQKTVNGFQSVRPVKLAISEKLRVPTAIGFFQPLVVLPEWTLKELSASQLNSILIHELAHLRRRDDWTNLAQKVLRALFFFHPAVWWVERQLAREREMACDDAVLSDAMNSPRAYAQCLVSLAEKSLVRRGLALAQAAVGRVGQTSERVLQILNVQRLAGTRIWKPAIGLVSVVSVACIVGLNQAPQLIAFRDTTPNSSFASATITGTPEMIVPGTRGGDETITPQMAERRTVPHKPVAAKLRQAPVAGDVVQARMTAPGALLYAPVRGADEVVAPEVQTVVVVMHTRQWDGYGAERMTVSVWRLTVVKAVQVPAPVAPAKST